MGWVDRLLLYPTRHVVAAGGAARRLLPFESGPLELFTIPSPGCRGRPATGSVLELMGNGGRAERAAATAGGRWGRYPVDVSALNWPGYGGSSGPPRLAAIVPAALAAFDAVAADGRPVLVAGHSLGAAAALAVAARRPVAGLSLANPPPLRQLIVGRYGWWNLWVGALAVASHVPADLDALANAARATAPAIFTSSGRDTLVPPSYHRRVFDASAGPKRLVVHPDAGHNALPDPATNDDDRLAMDWLYSQLNDDEHGRQHR